MTIKVIVDVHVKPDLAESYIARLKGAMAQTRAFNGCVEARLFRDQGDPAHLTVIERWESRADQEKYVAWRKENGGLPQAVYAQPLVFTFYDEVAC